MKTIDPETRQIRPAPRQASPRQAAPRLGLRVVVVALVVSGIFYLAVCAVVAIKLTEPERQPQRTTPAAYGIAYEDVSIRARDGVALAAWYMPSPGSQRAILMVHGGNQCRSCEMYGRFVELGSRLHAAGFNILMIDLRGHGNSEGNRFTLGDHERRDVLGAVDWLQQRGVTRIGVLAASMGAASSVEAAVDAAGGEAINALVLDSAIGHVPQFLEYNFPRQSGLPNWFLPGSLLMVRLLLRADLSAIRPVDELPKIKAPVMLIHSELDEWVPVAQFHAMAAARPDAETWLVADTLHVHIYASYPDEYTRRVSQFFERAVR